MAEGKSSAVYYNTVAADTMDSSSSGEEEEEEDEYDQVRRGIPDMIATEKKLESLLWFHPYLTRHQAESILKAAEEGCFLLRRRRTGWGTYSVDIRGKQSVRHFQATLTEQGIMLGNKSFPTAELFAEHFRSGIIIGDESGTVVECRHPYPREISEFDEYHDITCHFLVGQSTKSIEDSSTSEETIVGLSAAAKEGYLKKKGGVVKNWKTRWFVLKGNYLTYYHDHRQKKKAIRSLKLNDIKEVVDGHLEEEGCLFKIIFTWRTFFLVAPTQQSKQEWIALLKWKTEELRKKPTNSWSRR